MKISLKIILPILLISAIILGAVSYFFVNLNEQEKIISTEGFKIRTLNGLNERLVRQHQQTEYNVLAYRFNQSRASLLAIYQAELDKSKTLDGMYPYINTAKGRELIARYIDSRKEIEILRNELIKAIDNGDQEKITLNYNKWSVQNQNIKAALADIGAFNINSLEKTLISVGEIRNKIADLTIILMTVVVATILFYLFYLRMVITIPISKLAQFAREVTNQKFVTANSVDSSRKDELGDLFRTFNSMAINLKESYTTLEQKVLERTSDLQKFKLAVESATDGVVITDQNFGVIYVNPTYEKMSGLSLAVVSGKSAIEYLISQKISKEMGQSLFKTITAGKIFTSDDMILAGSDLAVRISIYPILKDNKPAFYVALTQDISRLKEIDKAKTEFVSLASHQLRTPLSAINWYAEMLLAGDAGKISADQKSYLEEIYAGNQRMVALVNALLNVSRLELGTFVIEPEPTDIKKLVVSVVEEQKPTVMVKKQNLKTDFSNDIPVMSVDPKLLRMVFQNLVSNAIKYTPEKGTISVSVNLDKKNLLFIVSDTGYGITKAQQSKIFTKLFRADNVRAKDTEGTGLGLYIVKSIVDHSGGKIWFESEENKGTTFYVSLPLKGMQKKVGDKSLS